MFSKEEMFFRTCQVLVRLFKNQVEENRETFHSRIFNYVIHPEYSFAHYGTSVAAQYTSPTHPEHAVPCAFMGRECMRLLKNAELSDEDIALLLHKHWKIVDVTATERHKIDSRLGYKSTMPEGWSFESGSTLARFEVADIEIIPANPQTC